MKSISAAGNTVVPALLALEQMGLSVVVERVSEVELFKATRGTESYSAEDPATLLGLVKLVELRGRQWRATDAEIDGIMRKYNLG